MDRENATANFYGENRALQVGQNFGTINYSDGGRLLSTTLPIARGASFDSYEGEHEARCLPGTRLDILQLITDWANDKASKPIFWLCGMAGTGKSTISRTVAEALSKRGSLGASFFFIKDDHDRNRAGLFFTTIAAQLAVYEPKLAPHVAANVNKDPMLPRKAMAEQFEHLIQKPFDSVASVDAIIVVDALDECEVQDVKVLVRLLARLCKIPRLRVFITSRPETAVLLGFSSTKGEYDQFKLHEIPNEIVERDLKLFFEHRLAEVRDAFNTLADEDQQLIDWPGQSVVNELSRISTPLFICAATICRMIDDPPNDPVTQLELFLKNKWKPMEGQLYKTYDYILRQSCQPDKLEEFKFTIGTIVLLLEPLPKASLADLLQIPRRTLDGRLASLSSVLRVSSGLVTMLHLSFRDFLLDATTKSDFAIDEESAHGLIFGRCLQHLSRNLHQNICNLRTNTLRSDIAADVIGVAISPATRYACIYWIEHFGRSRRTSVGVQLVRQFLKTNFLYWLEALSLLGESSKSVSLIDQLASFVEVAENNMLASFLYDAWRFVLNHRFVLELAPLQLYSSALVFSPISSVIRTYFMRCMPPWIRRFANAPLKWTACLQTQDCGSQVVSLVFSPDGNKLAALLGNDIIQLWNPVTGTILQTFDYGFTLKRGIRGISFSFDGAFIAIRLEDEIRIWDPATGIHHSGPRVPDHWTRPYCSPTENMLAVATSTGIQAWDIEHGAGTYRLRFTQVHLGVQFLKLAFSPEGNRLMSFGYEQDSSKPAIFIFEIATGNLVRKLPVEQCDALNSVVEFSPNGKFLAFHIGRIVTILNIETGELSEFHGHEPTISSLCISPNGELIAAGCLEGVTLVWNLATREIRQTFQDSECKVFSLSFSPTSSTLASNSSEGAYRLWDVQLSLHEHRSRVNRLVVYPQIQKEALFWSTTMGLWRIERSSQMSAIFSDPPDSSERDHSDTGVGHEAFPFHNLRDDRIAISVVSTDCERMVFATFDPAVYIIERHGGRHQLTYSGGEVTIIAFSPLDSLIVAADVDGSIFIWDADTLDIRHSIPGSQKKCAAIAFSTNEELLALTFEASETISIIDINAGAFIRNLRIQGEARCLAIDLGADLMVVTYIYGSTVLYQYSSGAYKRRIPAHPRIIAVSISDGLLVTNRGTYSLGERSSEYPVLGQSVGLVVNEDWVTYNGKPVLWVPPNFRSRHVAAQGSLVALSGDAPEPIIIRFQDLDQHFGSSIS